VGNGVQQSLIAQVYYTCAPAFGTDFGERRLTVDSAGFLRDAADRLTARYAVVPAGFGLRGRTVAENRKGRLILVAIPEGALELLGKRPVLRC
jgi:hypothetical protein